MGKKCIICSDAAEFCVKDTSDFYCKECAEENFGDLTLLVAIEAQAKDLKRMIDDRMDDAEQPKHPAPSSDDEF